MSKTKLAPAGERVGFKNYFGVTLMALADCLSSGLMTSWFMKYLTDYSGLANAAAIATILLLVMRLFDAVNDPIEAWIMDKAKVGKYGKYRPFIALSIVAEAVGVSALFSVPKGLLGIPVLAVIWLVVAYLIFDIGASFFAPNLIYRSITKDSTKWGKLMIAPRTLSMIIGMVTSSIISIVAGVEEAGVAHESAFGTVVLIAMAVLLVVSLVGLALVKEKYHPAQKEDAAPVKIQDIFVLFKENEALRYKFLATIFSGFIWTFLFAATTYYTKWAYCADLTTGAVNETLDGTYSTIAGMMMLFPLLIGTFIATPIMKAFKTPVRTYKFCIWTQLVPCGLMFVFQMLGILSKSPALLFILLGITATSIGIGYIPNEALNLECMDYELYKNGKERSALVNATAKFLDKAQNAVSSSLLGVILVAVGYVVDGDGNYAGELSNVPTMLNWFMVIMGLVPCIFGIISILFYNKYPVTPELAHEMRDSLQNAKEVPTEE